MYAHIRYRKMGTRGCSTFTASNIEVEKIQEVLTVLDKLGMMPVEATFSVLPERQANYVPEEDTRCETKEEEEEVRA